MNTFKEKYTAPDAVILNVWSDKLMIEIGSGNTSPEESDTNTSFFDENEDDLFEKQTNLWDD